ncbi:hypothetical protein PZ938_08165 [Luteipulveratus sp. YIM 133132]|uniref:hypothetical protein n=1 Tax=Luteipulveratus flavus TaxID=3031728 RepID=UPI0023AFAF29|nr:hypothetical protein [Luteipulveratus sp. YIM 133132]MDE9365579.1 hypothetical protein [Luteipulveratus sp. YIM 133132]
MSAVQPSECVVTRHELTRLGIDPATARDPDGSPTFLRLRRGSYVVRREWMRLPAAARLMVRAHVVSADADDRPMLTRHSAAAVWGMPLVAHPPDEVQILVSSGGRGSRPGVRRHRVTDVPPPVERDGLLLTPAARTVVDLARTSLVDGLAAADHALRHRLCTTAELVNEADAIRPRSRGRQQAITVTRLADRRAESAGESLSRLRLWQLGFPRPDLQVRFEDGQGQMFTDFGWDAYSLVGEFDGYVKYKVPKNATAEEASAVLWKEKQREDRVRRHRVDVARWVWRDAMDHRRLRSVLAGHGLRTDGAAWF